MSSYLLAFAISDFEYIDNMQNVVERNETYQRIIVRADSLLKAQYALDNSVQILEELESYVNFEYEINKLDSIGVPNKGGAMENWGFITYRENAVIYEENPDDIAHVQKMTGVRVIAHEMYAFNLTFVGKIFNYLIFQVFINSLEMPSHANGGVIYGKISFKLKVLRFFND